MATNLIKFLIVKTYAYFLQGANLTANTIDYVSVFYNIEAFMER